MSPQWLIVHRKPNLCLVVEATRTKNGRAPVPNLRPLATDQSWRGEPRCRSADPLRNRSVPTAPVAGWLGVGHRSYCSVPLAQSPTTKGDQLGDAPESA